MQEKEYINENPSYWSTLTADVRYSDKLTAFEKVLFSDITALANEDGYCNATNKYFAKAFNKSKSTISRAINNLIENEFLKGQYIFDENKEIIERRLFINARKSSY